MLLLSLNRKKYPLKILKLDSCDITGKPQILFILTSWIFSRIINLIIFNQDSNAYIIFYHLLDFYMQIRKRWKAGKTSTIDGEIRKGDIEWLSKDDSCGLGRSPVWSVIWCIYFYIDLTRILKCINLFYLCQVKFHFRSTICGSMATNPSSVKLRKLELKITRNDDDAIRFRREIFLEELKGKSQVGKSLCAWSS